MRDTSSYMELGVERMQVGVPLSHPLTGRDLKRSFKTAGPEMDFLNALFCAESVPVKP